MIEKDSLSQLSLLVGLASEELSALSQILTTQRFKKGSFVVQAGEMGEEMFFLASGLVHVSRDSTDGKEIIIAQFKEGDFFGELSLLTDEPRSANVIAAADSVVYGLRKADFEAFIQRHTGLAGALLKALALRLIGSTEKIGDLALFDVYRRVARTLRTLGEKRTLDGRDVLYIEKRPTHKELAAMVGTSREMVTRALKGLEEDEHIENRDSALIVYSVPR